MKSIFPFALFSTVFVFLAFPISSQNLTSSTSTSFYYKDKIEYLNFDEFESTQAKFPQKVIDAASNLKEMKCDAVVINSEKVTIKFSIALQSFLKLCQENEINTFIKIDLKKFFEQKLSSEKVTEIKSNIISIVKNTEVVGFLFSGINFSSDEQYELFEDILVENAMLKPFLKVAVSLQTAKNNQPAMDKLLMNGIIDFIIDEKPGYSICANSFIKNPLEEKLLKNYLKRIAPEKFVSLDLHEVVKDCKEVTLLNENRKKSIPSGSKIDFISYSNSDSLKLKVGEKTFIIPKNEWVIPYKYVLNRDYTVKRNGTWIEFRRPFQKNTNNDTYNLLCRTIYPSKVFINGEAVKIYKTGVFFKKIKLNEGLNKLRAEMTTANGETAFYEDRVLFIKPTHLTIDSALTINAQSIEPTESVTLMPDDFLTVSFNGSSKQKGFVKIDSEIFECSRSDNGQFSQYKTQVPLKNIIKNQRLSIKLILKPSNGNSKIDQVEKLLDNTLLIKDFNDFPILTTTSDNSIFTFTLAPIRLGAPLRNELPKNVILKSNGIFGDYYRIHLSETEEGFINKEFVKESANSFLPNYFINPISVYPTENADIVKIPYLENVPYDIYPDPAQKRIIINLYGVKTSSTWIIHKNKLKYIEEITWQQVSKETYKIYVNLKTSKIWGYDLKPNGKELIFRIKYPPVYNPMTSLPLKGIKFSLEAGHGGSNVGAVGLSGMLEKEINFKLCKLLEELLKKNGAQVFQVRDSDKDMTLTEKRDHAINSGANIHISIHANSSDPENEFLGTSGTCTFYNNPFWAPLAENIYYKMIELNLKPFGSVGSFNYRVIRMSDIPAILVEQAFMSNAEDEEKLYDDNFRKQMAKKIFTGIIDYLKYMQD